MSNDLVHLSNAQAILVKGQHPFEVENHDAIAVTWQRLQAENPAVYNGRTVLAESWCVHEGVFRAVCREVNYATLLHWLKGSRGNSWAVPLHFYAAPAIISGDSKALMGRMAAHTANAGRIYFPSGSMEREDFTDGMADFAGNMRREVLEETGIDLADAKAGEEYLLWQGRGVAALIREYRFEEAAETLRLKMLEFCRSEKSDGELDDILAFGPGATDPAMPSPMRAWLAQFEG